MEKLRFRAQKAQPAQPAACSSLSVLTCSENEVVDCLRRRGDAGPQRTCVDRFFRFQGLGVCKEAWERKDLSTPGSRVAARVFQGLPGPQGTCVDRFFRFHCCSLGQRALNLCFKGV